MNWHDKEILITGGTGSLGQTLVRMLDQKKPRGIRLFSRDEFKQWKMRQEFRISTPISYLLGDVRDYERLRLALHGVDIAIDAAALKQVPACEDNPLEAVKTNVHGAENLIMAALENNVETVLHVSTDKAVHPVNLYGGTKMVAEKLFTHANTYRGGKWRTKFICCRYGNVLGSRGSVLHVFRKQADSGTITITHKDMTRFFLPLKTVAGFILDRLEDDNQGGEIHIPKMPSCNIVDLARMIVPDCQIQYTGIRIGEKLHETLVSVEESVQTLCLENYFTILPSTAPQGAGWVYSSDTNPWKLTPELLQEMENG